MVNPKHQRIKDSITRAISDRVNHSQDRMVLAHLDRIATALEKIADKLK